MYKIYFVYLFHSQVFILIDYNHLTSRGNWELGKIQETNSSIETILPQGIPTIIFSQLSHFNPYMTSRSIINISYCTILTDLDRFLSHLFILMKLSHCMHCLIIQFSPSSGTSLCALEYSEVLWDTLGHHRAPQAQVKSFYMRSIFSKLQSTTGCSGVSIRATRQSSRTY